MRRTLGVFASFLIACSSGGTNPEGNILGGNDGGADANVDGFEPDLGGGDSDLPGFKQITIQPPNAVVKIDLTTGMPVPGTQAYKAIELQGDKEVDVSSTTTFS